MTQAWTERYRPATFDDVIGHDAVVASLQNALAKQTAKAFLLTGISGVGKTTLARIAATEAGCLPQDLLEIDAATYTGIDDMRQIAASLMFKPIGQGTVKAAIVDETHGLSKQAFDSLLKILENPPAWVYWFLCTTEPRRVPATIRTRCIALDLKPVPTRELTDFLSFIAKKEQVKADGVAALCAKEAQGSPRQAIANLALCAAARSLEEARELLRSAEGVTEAVELARLLVRGAGWPEIQGLLGKLDGVNPESVRHVVRAYITKVVLGAKSERAAGRGVEILDAFSTPFHPADGVSPLVIACAKAVLS